MGAFRLDPSTLLSSGKLVELDRLLADIKAKGSRWARAGEPFLGGIGLPVGLPRSAPVCCTGPRRTHA